MNLSTHASANWFESHSEYGVSGRMRQSTKIIRDITLFESAYHDQEFAAGLNARTRTSARSDLDANLSVQGFVHELRQENLTFTSKMPLQQNVFLDGRSNQNWVMRYSQWNQWVVSASGDWQTLRSPDFAEKMQNANVDVTLQDLIWLDSNARFELVPGLRLSSHIPIQNDQIDAIITPKLSTRMILWPHMVARVSYGMGYRRPTMKQKYWELFHQAPFNFLLRGNPDLNPERSHSIQSSLQWQSMKSLNISGSVFFNSLSNMITDQMVDSVPGVATDRDGMNRPYVHLRTYVNKKSAYTTGGDMSLEWMSKDLNIGLSYARLLAKERTENGDVDLTMQVPHSCKGHFAYTLEPARSTFRIQGTWNGAQLISTTPWKYSPDQILIDASISKNMGSNFDLSWGIDNIFDNWNSGQEAYYGLFDGRVYHVTIQAHY
jgi:outer membrane receptor for ferrienterochelin and colicins